jgi:hypothetical protein
MQTERQIRDRDTVLLAVDQILLDAGLDPHDVDRWANLKGRILALIDA